MAIRGAVVFVGAAGIVIGVATGETVVAVVCALLVGIEALALGGALILRAVRKRVRSGVGSPRDPEEPAAPGGLH
jgi:hypothetical protein